MLVIGAAPLVQRRWDTLGKVGRGVLAVALAACFALGFRANAVDGFRDLRADYVGRVAPLVERLRASEPAPVVVSNHFVAMELAALVEERAFVLARDGAELDAVAAGAADAGIDRLVFIGDASLQMDFARTVQSPAGIVSFRVAFQELLGDYALHEVRVAWIPTHPARAP